MTTTDTTEQAGWTEPEWPEQFSVIVDYPRGWPPFALVVWSADIYKPGPTEDPEDPFERAAELTFGLFNCDGPDDLPADSPYRAAVAGWRGVGRRRPSMSVGARVTVVDVAPGGATRRFVCDGVGWTDLDNDPWAGDFDDTGDSLDPEA